MDDFKKSFVKVKSKKKEKDKVAKGMKDKDYLIGDFRTLVDRLLDSKVILRLRILFLQNRAAHQEGRLT